MRSYSSYFLLSSTFATANFLSQMIATILQHLDILLQLMRSYSSYFLLSSTFANTLTEENINKQRQKVIATGMKSRIMEHLRTKVRCHLYQAITHNVRIILEAKRSKSELENIN